MTTIARVRRKILRNIRKSPKGGNGIYIQISKRKGIKITRAEYDSFEDLIQSGWYTSMQHEAKMMREAKRLYPYIPDCYGIRLLKLNRTHYTVAMTLQHLGKTRVSDVMCGKELNETVWSIEERLIDLGIFHNDVHYNNVMYFKGKYWVIDFGCARIKQP